jgi:type I restriction enzyme S subunit
VALIKFLESSPKASFIQALLSGPYLERIVKTQGRGGTQKFVSLGDLRKLSFPLPTKPEQERFEGLMGDLRIHVQKLEKSSRSQNDLFASLQHRAFRGEL